MADVVLTATKLAMLGKKGIIKPDADGYYEIVVSGLDIHNTSGIFYSSQGVEELFGAGSIIQRRVSNGAMRAEVNHPQRLPGQSDEEFARRLLEVDLNNVCAHFKSLWLDRDFGRKNPVYNRPQMMALMALVKPAGPKASIFQEQLDNANENCCFSIRATAKVAAMGGQYVRFLRDVISIDLINEGGIPIASKWDSPATESAASNGFSSIFPGSETVDDLTLSSRLIERIRTSAGSPVAMESSSAVAEALYQKYFQKETTRPGYTHW